MRPPYSCGVLRVALCAVLAAAISSIGAATAPAAERADASVFGGLGTWVDIYDGAGLRGARAIGAAHGCTARQDRLGGDGELRRVRRRRGSRSARPARRRAPHARDPRRRLVPPRARQAGARHRRALAMLAFRTPEEGRSTASRSTSSRRGCENAALRSQRAVDARAASFARLQATRRSRSSRSTRAGSSGARRRGRGFPGRSSRRAPTRSRR